MARIILNTSIPGMGLKIGYTYDVIYDNVEHNDKFKHDLVDANFASYYNENELVAGISKFTGQPFNKGMLCSNYFNTYRALVDNTNTIFDVDEWEIAICSCQVYTDRRYCEFEQVFYEGHIYEATVNTQNTFIPSEWVLRV